MRVYARECRVKAAVLCGLFKLLFISSLFVHGNTRIVSNRDTEFHPLSFCLWIIYITVTHYRLLSLQKTLLKHTNLPYPSHPPLHPPLRH